MDVFLLLPNKTVMVHLTDVLTILCSAHIHLHDDTGLIRPRHRGALHVPQSTPTGAESTDGIKYQSTCLLCRRSGRKDSSVMSEARVLVF